MTCLKCHTENKNSLSHCENCGAPLLVIKRRSLFRNRTMLMVFFVVLLVIGGIAYIYWDTMFPLVQMTETQSAIDREKNKQGKQNEREGSAVLNDEQYTTNKAEQTSSEDLHNGNQVIAGWVTINDPWGRQVRNFRAGLAGSGWLALPTRACLGGNSWHFTPDAGPTAEISGGLWISGDKVGLWHLAENSGKFEGPELVAWNHSEPVSWISLESANEHHSIRISDRQTEGFFLSFTLPDYINEMGLFIQQGKIVGWSFGRWLTKGYLWPGKEGTELEYKTLVRYFYNITFANGQEEKFAMALAMQQDSSVLDQLASFIEGFGLQPKLLVEDIPDYLLPDEIIKRMRVLISNALHSGEGTRVVDMLSSQVLKSIGDINLLMDIIPVITDAYGYEAAIEEIEDSGRYIVRHLGHDVPALDTIQAQLYQEWLQSLITQGEVDKGLQVYDASKTSFPDDPTIHLLGVELALLSGDWEEAERLLYMRSYPPELQDRYQLLALRISEMKGQEEKIVINFPRGSNRITVTAAINETFEQDFLVDTGATIVTIPSSTANALGLEIVHGHRTLSTASGSVIVSEVILDTIEIDGWGEYDIRAVILDMPDRPGLGLLGLNYLRRFQMDLRTEEGILLLTPQ